MSKFIAALASLGALATVSAQEASLGDLVFTDYDVDTTGMTDAQKAAVDMSNYCSESACNNGDCVRTWVYTGNGAFQDIDPLPRHNAGGLCTKDSAVEYIANYELVELTMGNDDLGQMMLQLEQQLYLRKASLRSSGEEDPSVDETLAEVRRFKNLKAMVMTLQPVNVTVFGRYCYYGCWCLPNGMHNLAAGYGVPVDAIDVICKQFALCYKCLDIDMGGYCDPEARAYRWKRLLDGNGIPYDIECLDNYLIGPTHRCKRWTCECDRVLSIGLMHTHWVWNESFHARWGGFDREGECESDCTNADNCYPPDDCCGAYGSASTDQVDAISRRPYATTNPNLACCQDVFFFNPAVKECCLDDSTDPPVISVVDINTCNGADQTKLDPDEIEDFNEDFPGYSKK